MEMDGCFATQAPTNPFFFSTNPMSGSSIYNVSGLPLPLHILAHRLEQHRSLQPTARSATAQAPAPPCPPRLNEAFDAIKLEFDNVAAEVEHVKSQKDDIEVKRMFDAPLYSNLSLNSRCCSERPNNRTQQHPANSIRAREPANQDSAGL